MRKKPFVLICLLLLITLSACGTEKDSDVEKQGNNLNDGEYTAIKKAYGGDITIQLTVEDGKISKIEAPNNTETKNVGGIAINKLTENILKYQSPNVDTISGATLTSFGYLNAVKDCLEQAGADLSLYEKAVVEDTIEDEYTVDVVVVGGGLSGLSTATRLSEDGLNVLVLEKQSFLGGCSHMSLGSFMVAEVETNEGLHITDEEDTMEQAMARWHKKMDDGNNAYPDYDRVEYMLTESMFTLDWLKNQGVTFEPKSPIADRGMAMVQGDADAGIPGATASSHIIALLEEKITENNGTILLDTPAVELISEDGVITGVKANHKGQEITVHADNVVLASGGFAANVEMQKELMPNSPEFFTITASGNTGDGINMAKSVGAAVYEDNWLQPAWPGPTNEFYRANPNAKFIVEVSSPISIEESTYDRMMVDSNGERFMNEAQPYGNQQVIMVDHGGTPYWSIYSNVSNEAMDIFKSGEKTGTVIIEDSLEALAGKMGANPDTFVTNAKRYDEMVKNGEDTDFGKDPSRLQKPVGENGPFVAVQVLPGSVDSFGGVKTNINQQVLNEEKEPISGLYAVGSMANRLYYNHNYLSGSQLTFGASTGRLAAEHIISTKSE